MAEALYFNPSQQEFDPGRKEVLEIIVCKLLAELRSPVPTCLHKSDLLSLPHHMGRAWYLQMKYLLLIGRGHLLQTGVKPHSQEETVPLYDVTHTQLGPDLSPVT